MVLTTPAVSAKAKTSVTPPDMLFCPMFTAVSVLCYWPSCYNCSHNTLIFKYVTLALETDDNRSAKTFPDADSSIIKV
jgi:hypothetical protein